ncbi:LuxR C-terminal-related transcriptional regulator [Klebsiella oxytoca]|uniref:LuxR C-terminal-related transcriptional regulator n=1 Tax=Klebsiella oxytoca TaxID=571 RepID=UPI00157B35A3
MNTTISLLWRDWLASPHFMQLTDCLSCKCRQMSTKQFQIVTQYYEGRSVNEIAIDMGLNYKTVFRHKYQVMNKYNLHSDIELLTFLNVLAQKTT